MNNVIEKYKTPISIVILALMSIVCVDLRLRASVVDFGCGWSEVWTGFEYNMFDCDTDCNSGTCALEAGADLVGCKPDGSLGEGCKELWSDPPAQATVSRTNGSCNFVEDPEGFFLPGCDCELDGTTQIISQTAMPTSVDVYSCGGGDV